MANNKIQVKRTSTAGRTPNTTNAGNTQYISAGELALNMTDQTFFTSDGTNLIYVGSNVVNQHVTNSLTLDNDKQLRFKTVNTSAQAYFVQQNDDNFVFYTTNTSYGARAVWSIYANNNTANLKFATQTTFNGNVDLNIVAVYANGSPGTAGQVLTSNGTSTYWTSAGAAAVNTAAQYTWTNTQTFSANISFTGNGIGLTTNTGAIYLGGIGDANWKIGRNTGVTTKWKYTNNTIDIVTANSNLEGMAIGLVNGNSYFETGYLGTFIANTVTIGNSASNSTVNSTVFSGTANNASYLGGTLASGYQTTAGLSANVATLSSNNASYLGTVAAASYVQNTDSRTLSGNLVISGTYFNPSANTILLGNSTQRWVLSANTGDFSSSVNAASHTVGTAFTANSTVVNAVAYYSGTLLIANSTVSNATHLGGTAAAGYQTTAGLSANVATLTANNSTYFGGYTWSAPAILGGTTANGASLTYANVSGQVNTATLYATTSANIASIVQANSTGIFIGANVIANTTALDVGNTTFTTTNAIFGGTIATNGSIGTAGQVLTSGAGTNAYWSTISTGGATISETAPSSPSAGALWFNSSDASMSVYYSDGTSSQWVALGGYISANSLSSGSGFEQSFLLMGA